jgi:hypothetical protein
VTDVAVWDARINNVQALSSLHMIEAALAQIDKNNAIGNVERKIDQVGKTTGTTTKSMSAAWSTFSVAAGMEIVKLGNQFVASIKADIEAVKQFSIEAAQVAQTFNILRTGYISLYGGNIDAAENMMAHLRDVAIATRVDIDAALQFGKILLPSVSDVQQIDSLIQSAKILSKIVPGKTFEDATQSIRMASMGLVRSLRSGFTLPASVMDSIKEYQKEMGNTAGLAKGLEVGLAKVGYTMSNLKMETISGAYTTIGNVTRDLTIAFGEPVLGAEIKSMKAVGDYLVANSADLEALAGEAGQIVADILDGVTQLGLKIGGAFDPEKVSEILASIDMMVQDAILMAEVISKTEFSTGFMGTLATLAKLAEGAPKAGAQQAGLASAENAANMAELKYLAESGLQAARGPGFLGMGTDAAALLKLIQGGGVAGGLARLTLPSNYGPESMIEYAAGVAPPPVGEAQFAMNPTPEQEEAIRQLREKAFATVINPIAGAISTVDAERDAAIADYKARREAIAKRAGNPDEAGLPHPGMLSDQELQDMLKLSDQMVGSEQDLTRKLLDEDTRRQNERLDIALRESRYREDIAQATADKIADINEAHTEAVAQAYADQGEAVAKFEVDAAEQRKTQAADTAKQMVDIERDYRRKLEDIRTEFNRSARDAALKNDAIAYLQARRTMNDSMATAKTERGRSKDDANATAKDQEVKLIQSLEKQRAELNVSFAKKLADLDKSLAKQEAALDKENARAVKAHDLMLDRETKDRDIAQGRWETALRTSLDRQLLDTEDKWGLMTTVTSDELLAQANAFIAQYGEGGANTMTMQTFFADWTDQLIGVAELQAKLAAQPASPGGWSPMGSTVYHQDPTYTLPASGQSGLVSRLLSLPYSALISHPGTPTAPASSRRGGGAQSLTFNFRGVEPYLQRVAVTAAVEVFRNVMAR